MTSCMSTRRVVTWKGRALWVKPCNVPDTKQGLTFGNYSYFFQPVTWLSYNENTFEHYFLRIYTIILYRNWELSSRETKINIQKLFSNGCGSMLPHSALLKYSLQYQIFSVQFTGLWPLNSKRLIWSKPILNRLFDVYAVLSMILLIKQTVNKFELIWFIIGNIQYSLYSNKSSIIYNLEILKNINEEKLLPFSWINFSFWTMKKCCTVFDN